MIRTNWIRGFGIMLLALTASVAAKANDANIRAYSDKAAIVAPKLSPKGDRIAMMIWEEGENRLLISSLTGEKPQKLAPKNRYQLTRYWWANNDTMLVLYSKVIKNRGDRDRHNRLYSFNLQEGKLRPMVKKRKSTDREVSNQGGVLSLLPGDADHVLMNVRWPGSGSAEIVKMNIKSGTSKAMEGGGRGMTSRIVDTSGKPRLTWGYPDPGQIFRTAQTIGEIDAMRVFKSSMSGNEWNSLGGSAAATLNTYFPRGMLEDGQTIVGIGSMDSKPAGVFGMPANNPAAANALFNDQTFSVTDLAFDDKSGAVIGARMDLIGRTVYFDPAFKQAQQHLASKLRGLNIEIVSNSSDKKVFIASASNSQMPAIYFLFDTRNGQIRNLGKTRPALPAGEQGMSRLVSFKAADGMDLKGVVDLPAGFKGEAIGFVVIAPGMGSGASLDWGHYKRYINSLGYGVFTPIPRGSMHLDGAYHKAGLGQWNGKIISDMQDGVNWLIGQGLATKGRICASGTTISAMTALSNVANDNGTYACAIVQSAYPKAKFWNTTKLTWTDQESAWRHHLAEYINMNTISDERFNMIRRIDEVRVPVLVATSTGGDNVDEYNDSNSVYGSTKENGSKLLIVEKTNNEIYSHPENRFKFYKAVGDMLKSALK